MYCKYCNSFLNVKWGSGKYCNKTCQSLYANSIVTFKKVICISCNIEFETNRRSLIKKCNSCKNTKTIKDSKIYTCKNCNIECFSNYGSYIFCSSKCARSFSANNGNKNYKILKCIKCNTEILKSKNTPKFNMMCDDCKFVKCVCNICSKSFLSKNKKETCSKKCYFKFKSLIALKDKTYKKLYDKLSNFKFDLKNYKDEFDFTLYEKFGVYKAKNSGNNQKGITRDHKISKLYGFKNKINPLIISHPANCALLQGNINQSKNSKCSISLEILLNSINDWHKKYGNFYKENILNKIYINFDELEEIFINHN